MLDYDLLIIGGGVAGLTAAQYGARSGLKTALIEGSAPGGQALQIDELENYPGYDGVTTGYEMATRFQAQAEKFGAEILYTLVQKIEKKDDLFEVTTDEGLLTAHAVIMATGAKHRNLGISGEETFAGRGVSYCATCDGPFFKNCRILVVGGGDTACAEAIFLSKLTSKVTMIHRKERFRAQKAVADQVFANKNIDVRFNTIPLEIIGNHKVEKVLLKDLVSGSETEIAFDAVFIFVGTLPQTGLVSDCVNLDNAGYIETDIHLQTKTPGLYAAGDVRNTPFRQIVTAAADGAIAAHSANEYIDSLKGDSYQ